MLNHLVFQICREDGFQYFGGKARSCLEKDSLCKTIAFGFYNEKNLLRVFQVSCHAQNFFQSEKIISNIFPIHKMYRKNSTSFWSIYMQNKLKGIISCKLKMQTLLCHVVRSNFVSKIHHINLREKCHESYNMQA